ncbi:hypothetical protein [Guyparkeria sp. SCN-R1]|uniref:hypothetical protein n=1 Tax=Guyparkeria sp. SCN-R1 TaxID=2341113 RepID=UPI000F6488B0|nr:hypothetical protein [Guyparkeria sp. SCN-R1]
MAKLTIIVGVGASGKSTLRKQICEKTGARGFEDGTAVPRGNDRRRAGHRALPELVARLLGPSAQDCVLDESHLVHERFRKEFQRFCDKHLPGVEQEWIFFNNDLAACASNAYFDAMNHGRKDASRFRSILGQSKKYVVPEVGSYPGHDQVLSVYQQEKPQFRTGEEEKARKWLKAAIKAVENGEEFPV